MDSKQPPHLAFGYSFECRHLGHVQSIFEMRVEHGEQPLYAGMTRIHALSRLEALGVLRTAHPVVDEFFGHGGSYCTTKVLSDEVQHHIHRCCGSGRRETPAVDFKDSPCDPDLWELINEAFHVFPMNGGVVVVEEASPRQYVGAGFDGTHRRALLGKPTKPSQHAACHVELRIKAAHDNGHLATGDSFDRAVDIERQAVARANRSAVVRKHLPLIESASGYRIGLPERFDRGGKGQHRELLQEQDRNIE